MRIARTNPGRGPDKLVWVLEHNYSNAGLSLDALKNADAAVAGVLKPASEAAEPMRRLRETLAAAGSISD